MTQPLMIVCPRCRAANRVPPERLAEHPNCGKCGGAMFDGNPAELDAAGLDAQLARSDIPLVVDFWAPWCGPCRMMAPALVQATRQIEPNYRIAKVDTEAHPALASRFAIRSIPTLIAFRAGREIARQAGAMDAGNLVRWIGALG